MAFSDLLEPPSRKKTKEKRKSQSIAIQIPFPLNIPPLPFPPNPQIPFIRPPYILLLLRLPALPIV
jgi:hypothetical protein